MLNRRTPDASNRHPIRMDPSDRWRLFAVAARGSAVKSVQDVDLYAAQLRARRALTHIYTHDRKDWLQILR